MIFVEDIDVVVDASQSCTCDADCGSYDNGNCE